MSANRKVLMIMEQKMKFRRGPMVWALAACLLFLSPAATADEGESGFVPKELLVKFKLGKNEETRKEIQRLGAKLLEKLSAIDVSRLSLPKGLTVERAMEIMSKLNIVEFAEPNYLHRTTWSPRDPRYGEQWGVKQIRTAKGWGIHTGRCSTVIAIIDTGVDLDHPDLKNKIVSGYDFVDGDNQADDQGGHGTHCAGIAAASVNNNVGISGVCANCSIMPVRVLRSDGGGPSSNVAKGIIFAADNGAQIISLSLGTYSLSSTVRDAVEYATKKNALVIAAAGNNNTNAPHYPAFLPQSISVGATDENDVRSEYSNYGAWVDVAAPGNHILSTFPDGDFAYKNGTSMATPFVAGLAGLMFSCPGATPKKIREAILTTGKPVGDWLSGRRIDVAEALEQIGCNQTEPPVSPAPTTAPTPTSTPKPSPAPSTTPAPASAPTPAPAPTPTTSPSTVGIPVSPPSPASGAQGGGAPIEYTILQGTIVKDPKEGLTRSDNLRLILKSRGEGFKNALDVFIEGKVVSTIHPKGSTLHVSMEGYTDNPGEFQSYLYNWSKQAWEDFERFRLETQDQIVTLSRSAAGYVGKDGVVRIKIYRKESRWNGFEMGIDRIQLEINK